MRFRYRIAWLLLMPIWVGSVFGYLEDKIYCQVQGEQLTLYVKKEEGSDKCETTIRALEQMARNKYDEVVLVLDYISQEDNSWYRKEVFEIKKQEFLKILNYKNKIQNAIVSFEEKFFLKYQEALSTELSPYLAVLREQQTLLASSLEIKEHYYIREKYQQISQQISTLEQIFSAISLDEIMIQIPSYLYLKEQIQWT